MKEGSDAAAATVAVDEPAPGVRRLRIANKAQHGALSAQVLTALEKATAESPASAHCLLLTGSGTTFSAGYDLAAVGVPPVPGHAEATIAPDHVAALSLLERQPLPIVAAVNGPAFGGGLELLLTCDVRIAVASASLSAPAGLLGLVYSPGGLERVLAEVPFAVAAELFLSAATLTAERAYQLGLFSQIVAPAALDQAAMNVASRIAGLAPASVRSNRAALRALRRERARLAIAERERLHEAREQAMRSEEFAEGIRAFRERRPPRFDTSRSTAASTPITVYT